jgi:hypothetical protein
MQMGEPVAVLTISDDDQPCPFCASKASDKFETKELVNDSSKLAKALAGMPRKTMRHPLADFEVGEAYYVTDNISGICMNAHHVIPGNASIGKCPEVMQWMAGTTKIKKVFYKDEIKMKVKKVHPSKQDAERARIVAEMHPDHTVYGSPDMEVVFSTKKRRSGVTRTKTVSENLVTGRIDFDINDAKNGEWLPSNNAVVGWAKLEHETAQDFSGRGPELDFHVMYAHHAMRVTKRQFHDTHDDYSNEVKIKMKELDLALNDLATACLTHEGTRSKAPDGPFPAPQRLTAALYKVADVIRNEHLILKSTAPVAPWTTSVLSTEAGVLL